MIKKYEHTWVNMTESAMSISGKWLLVGLVRSLLFLHKDVSSANEKFQGNINQGLNERQENYTQSQSQNERLNNMNTHA